MNFTVEVYGDYLLFCRFVAEPAGTHYWHSHTGMQRSDGMFGSLVVRQPKERDRHYDLYDFDLSEHVLIVNDWLSEMAEERYSFHYHSWSDNYPKSVIINGKLGNRNFVYRDFLQD